MRLHVSVPAAVAALAVVVAGCGGGGSRLSKDEYITKADAICQSAQAKISAIGQPQSPQELAQMADQVASIGQDELTQLRALNPPAADEATLNQAYGLLEQQVALVKQVSDAAKAGQSGKVGLLVAKGSRIDAQANRIANDYGLQICGKP